MGIEVIWVVIIIMFVSCWWSVIALDKKINEVEKELDNKIDVLKSDITRIEQYQQDIVNSMLVDEFNLLGLHRYARELEKIYNQIDLLIKEKGVSDLGLYNELCSKRSELRNRIRKTYDDIMQTKMKGNSNE